MKFFGRSKQSPKTPPAPAERKGESGSSLFEVTLAIGLLAGVLGSVAGMFVLGAGSVKRGRNSTEALAITRSIVEEMQSWRPHDLHANFGCDATLTSCVIQTDTAPGGEQWQQRISDAFGNASATISISSLNPGFPPLETSTQFRVLVTTNWKEGSRARKVRLGTVVM